jgi:hypothetical protein
MSQCQLTLRFLNKLTTASLPLKVISVAAVEIFAELAEPTSR